MKESSRGPTRRTVLAAGSAAALGALAGCERSREAGYDGGWVGAAFDRGHLLRSGMPTTKSGALPEVAVARRVGVVVVGAGIAGLAAARALLKAGVDDVHVLELEDTAGGNSRGHVMGGMRCPLGAHYLPGPSDKAIEVIELLEALGLRKTVNGRVEYDERTLCQSPQERLFINGGWRDGLLPPIEALPEAERAATLAQYRGFAAAVAELGRGDAFAIPTARSRWTPALDALDATTFAAWLDGRSFVAPALRWYLDYCCRDDYGAGAKQVSAWAGIHYFASRHGFRAPGSDDTFDGDNILTWPEGNGWLAQRLAAPLGERLHAGRVALRVSEGRDAVSVDAWNVASQQRETWTASQAILATPLFVSARILETPPPALVETARRVRHAPWLVADLQLAAALDDQPGAPLSWDNVLYDSADRAGLGYVDDMHQSTLPFAGPTVLSAYRALGGDSDAELAANRARLLGDDWRTWAERVVADLASAHPDLRHKLKRVDLMRYGHAMAIPSPGVRSSAALRSLAASATASLRLHFAHADLSAYSVFEEALFHGTRAGRAAAGAVRQPASYQESPPN